MKINIYDLLPEKISDESAYHLVEFFMNLSLELESCYFVQMKRYIDENMQADSPDIFQKKIKKEKTL